MLTKPRLHLFEGQSLAQRMKNSVIEGLFGMVPAAMAVDAVHTRLDRAGFEDSKRLATRLRTAWSPGDRECFSAFVSSLNQCRF